MDCRVAGCSDACVDFSAAGPPPLQEPRPSSGFFRRPRVMKGLRLAEREDSSRRISLTRFCPTCRCEPSFLVALLPPRLHLPSLSAFTLRGKQLLGQAHSHQLFCSQEHRGKITVYEMMDLPLSIQYHAIRKL